MSFSQDVKNEIVQKKITRECCALAASYGIACFGRYFDSKGLVLHTELLGVAQYAKRLFGICGVHGAIITKERPSGPLYEFKVDDPQEVDKMLKLFHCEEEQVSRHIDPRLIRCGHCFSAFVASAFLCCGTMTDPSKEYNLEFLCPRYNLAKDLEGILAEHEFTPRRTVRKGVNVIYVKASEQVADLLTFMGAGGAAMQIMDHKMFKELRNKTNRLNNCEMANIGGHRQRGGEKGHRVLTGKRGLRRAARPPAAGGAAASGLAGPVAGAAGAKEPGAHQQVGPFPQAEKAGAAGR